MHNGFFCLDVKNSYYSFGNNSDKYDEENNNNVIEPGFHMNWCELIDEFFDDEKT